VGEARFPPYTNESLCDSLPPYAFETPYWGKIIKIDDGIKLFNK